MAVTASDVRPVPPCRWWRRRLAVLALLAAVAALACAVRGRRRPGLPAPMLEWSVLARVTTRGQLGVLPGRTHLIVGWPSPQSPVFEVVEARTGATRTYRARWPEAYLYARPVSADGTLWWVHVPPASLTGTDHSELRSVTDGGARPLPGGLGPGAGLCDVEPRTGWLAATVTRPNQRSDLLVVRMGGPGRWPLARGKPRADGSTQYNPIGRWSPDGRKLLVASMGCRGYTQAVELGEPGSTATRRVSVPSSVPSVARCLLYWLGSDSLLVSSGTNAWGRLEISDGRWYELFGEDPSDRLGGLKQRLGQPPRLNLVDTCPDGQWLAAWVTWTEHSSRVQWAGEHLAWLLKRWKGTAPAAGWVEARVVAWQRDLFVFDRDGDLRWQVPAEPMHLNEITFLADGRLCWLQDGEVRVARLPAERGASQLHPSP